jgi:hypothetical protein
MKVPYGEEKEYYTFSLFLVLCNRGLTCAVCVFLLWVSPAANDSASAFLPPIGVKNQQILETRKVQDYSNK